MVLSSNRKSNSKLLFSCLIVNLVNIQLSISLPIQTSKYSGSSATSKGQSHVSFTLFKRVSDSEWNKFVKSHQNDANKEVLLLVEKRPGIIPISHYAYKIQHPSRDNSISNRIHFTDPFDRNFDRQPIGMSMWTLLVTIKLHATYYMF
jgi:hypothetical protein